MHISQLLCLCSFLVPEYLDYDKYVLCSGSSNCVCPINATSPDSVPLCIDLADVHLFCPQVKY